jgi:16S rRNA (guanine527-N7)-methyltransferase
LTALDGQRSLTLISEGLAALGIAATPALAERLRAYLVLLEKWNRAYNLTSVTEPDDMVVRHVLDSASALPFLHGEAVLDAGTGAGLPGIPLALIDPARHFTLLDSVGKKIRFLRQAVLELGLSNVTPLQARAEDWHPPVAFDTVTSRALGTLAEFAGWCGHLVAPGGRLLAMKGRHPAAEIERLPPGWRVAELVRVVVPGLAAERHVVVLERAP